MASRYLPLLPHTFPIRICALTVQMPDSHVSAIPEPLHLSSTHTVATHDQPADHLHHQVGMDTGNMLAQPPAHMETAVLAEVHIGVRLQIRSMLWRDDPARREVLSRSNQCV